MSRSEEIGENLLRVRERIAAACARVGRAENDVKLIAVSKTKPVELVQAALSAGQRSFGENYVQEATEKIAALPEADWHFIGSLQTNKAKLVVGKVALIHSVDRERLAIEIARAAERSSLVQDVLVQVHIGDETTKQGATFEEAPRLIEQILSLKNLRLRGIMALPPLFEDESEGRRCFAALRKGLEKWRAEILCGDASFSELSMGTSSDYEWAILEGATQVRVGTAIFGAREAAGPSR